MSAPSNVFLQHLRKHQNVRVMHKLAATHNNRLKHEVKHPVTGHRLDKHTVAVRYFSKKVNVCVKVLQRQQKKKSDSYFHHFSEVLISVRYCSRQGNLRPFKVTRQRRGRAFLRRALLFDLS